MKSTKIQREIIYKKGRGRIVKVTYLALDYYKIDKDDVNIIFEYNMGTDAMGKTIWSKINLKALEQMVEVFDESYNARYRVSIKEKNYNVSFLKTMNSLIDLVNGIKKHIPKLEETK